MDPHDWYATGTFFSLLLLVMVFFYLTLMMRSKLRNI
jgi:hypothetical protein